MSPEELKTILYLHQKWLRGEAGGKLADLHGVDLRNADLRHADLMVANLNGADLRGCNLREVIFFGADLSDADLSGADLRGADLREANISGARIDLRICRMDFGRWSICVYADKTSIGCQSHPNEDWLSWTPKSEAIKRMHPEASALWEVHGKAIKAAIRCVMAKAKGGDA